MSDLNKLQSRLGYVFGNQALLLQSLTHSSHGAFNNERLEYLGDAVLGMIIGCQLYHQFPDATEGELTRLRASLIRQSTLAEVAREVSLGDHIIMSDNELKRGGCKRDSTLSDTLEAVIGAVLLDSTAAVPESDLPAGRAEAATQCVLAWFDKRLADLSVENMQKDAKSRLQEHLQALGEPLPEYVLLEVTGKAPNQKFEVECRIRLPGAPARARAGSLKVAEQRAAGLVLAMLGVSF